MLEEYLELFSKHYPAYNVEMKSRLDRDGNLRFRVFINGDDGGMSLSEDDVRFAIRMFKR